MYSNLSRLRAVAGTRTGKRQPSIYGDVTVTTVGKRLWLALLLGSPVVVSTLGEVFEQGVAAWELNGADSAETFRFLFDDGPLRGGVDGDDLLRDLAVVSLLVEGLPSQSLVLFAETALELLLVHTR